jgi:hypothetical protein
VELGFVLQRCQLRFELLNPLRLLGQHLADRRFLHIIRRRRLATTPFGFARV